MATWRSRLRVSVWHVVEAMKALVQMLRKRRSGVTVPATPGTVPLPESEQRPSSSWQFGPRNEVACSVAAWLSLFLSLSFPLFPSLSLFFFVFFHEICLIEREREKGTDRSTSTPVPGHGNIKENSLLKLASSCAATCSFHGVLRDRSIVGNHRHPSSSSPVVALACGTHLQALKFNQVVIAHINERPKLSKQHIYGVEYRQQYQWDSS